MRRLPRTPRAVLGFWFVGWALLGGIACNGGFSTADPTLGKPTATVDGGHDAASIQMQIPLGDADLPQMGDGGLDELPAPTTAYPAPHPAPLQARSLGGPVLKTPKVVTVTFDGDDQRSALEDFGKTFGASSFWTANVSEYGVGALAGGATVHLNEMVPTTFTDADITAWILGKLGGAQPEFGPPDPSTIYLVYMPTGTTVTFDGKKSCEHIFGYHSSAQLPSGVSVPYAIVPRCDQFLSLTGIDTLTVAASHELIEAATDPFPFNNTAYGDVDPDHVIWALLFGGGELADLCANLPNVDVKPAGFPYTVQRSWSNQAALAGHSPCVPSTPGDIYFNAVPVLPDVVSFTSGSDHYTTPGVRIPVGESRTIEVDFFSDAERAPWIVHAKDAVAAAQAGDPELSFAWDNVQGNNGTKRNLTITVLKEDPAGYEGFFVISQKDAATYVSLGLVTYH
jgi:hypothetical protein